MCSTTELSALDLVKPGRIPAREIEAGDVGLASKSNGFEGFHEFHFTPWRELA